MIAELAYLVYLAVFGIGLFAIAWWIAGIADARNARRERVEREFQEMDERRKQWEQQEREASPEYQAERDKRVIEKINRILAA